MFSLRHKKKSNHKQKKKQKQLLVTHRNLKVKFCRPSFKEEYYKILVIIKEQLPKAMHQNERQRQLQVSCNLRKQRREP